MMTGLDLENFVKEGSDKLKWLTLTGNSLAKGSSIPQAIGGMTELTVLDLGDVGLTGKIPESLGDCSKLLALFLGSNELTGTIPSILGDLALLQVLSVDSNKLTGRVPASLGNLTSLAEFTVFDNNLSGSMPASICTLRGSSMYMMFASDCLQDDNVTVPSVVCECCDMCCNGGFCCFLEFDSCFDLSSF
uniref:L domain-like protein n=2 Tax=Odontella aurita TaxID=265563 RepID=A0A7S4HN02_9STRA|mmetsp:Transcript_1258/g.3384  ORF Transcript_1258/g.3384 Transcript_1258/m.3384 type:complete len:190 (+) Transcript_1258:261-830(+)